MKTLRATPSPVPKLASIFLLILTLSGCASFSDDGGFGLTRETAEAELGLDAVWFRDGPEDEQAAAQSEVDRLLAAELTPQSAVQIALLNNPGLQAAYAELGLSEADYVQASRLPNPGFSFERTTGGGAKEIERGLEFAVISILTMPFRMNIEAQRFEAAKLRAAADMVDVAMMTRKAYYRAIAAGQGLDYMREVVDAARASRDLMSRLSRVGNASRLELAREQLFLAEVTTALAQAARAQADAREVLARHLGLWGGQLDFTLPARLPEIPDGPQEIEHLEQTALAGRLDLKLARHELDALSKNLGLTESTRFINVLDAGPVQVRDKGEPVRDGYHILFEIPLFDWGDARVVKARLLHAQAKFLFREAAIDARSQIRSAYQSYRTSYDIARHYRDEIVPLRKHISDEQLLRYNGMLVGVFELITDAQEQILTVNGYMRALLDFWIAQTELEHAMLSSVSPGGLRAADTAVVEVGGQPAGH